MSKPSFPRSRRLNAIIQEVLAEEVERLTDPRLSLVSVTGVDVAPDMRHAVVFVSALDHAQLDETLKGLAAAAPRLRAALGRQIRTKYTPELEFKADTGVVEGERIDALLRQIRSEDGGGDTSG
ncbi:MAG TPA: 30S ribosome-binding factor RbfA [Acidimicrobiia bacterium]|nr:30S ribosome-binding factor RbfA [Acidimicrobiia bacterium]